MESLIYYILIFLTIFLLGFLIFLLFKESRRSIKLPENIPLTLKAQFWLGENYKLILLGSLLFALISANTVLISLLTKENQIKLCQQTLYKMANKVLVLTPDKRIANVVLSDIKPKAIKYYFDDKVTNFVISKLCILGENNSFPTDYTQIPEYCYNAKKVLNSGLLSEQGKETYMLALKGIYTLAKLDKLPEIIKPQDVESQAYITKKGNVLYYKYVASIKSLVKYIPLGSNRLYQAIGYYKIVLIGRINPEKGDIHNPFGVVIDYIKLEPPLKPENTE
jgi:hypothetical protein